MLPFRNGSRIVELGGGETCVFRPNVDVRPGPTVDIVADFNNPLPIPDKSYDGVYSSYNIEHMSWRKVKQFISEIYRILDDGGVVFVITANLYEQCKSLIKEDWVEDDICRLFGGQNYSGNDWISNAHYCGFSPNYAVKLFREAGFSTVITIPHPHCKTDLIIEAHKYGKKSNNFAVWANSSYSLDTNHMKTMVDIVRVETIIDDNIIKNGIRQDKPRNSALHWSRVFEYPWSINNLELNNTDVVLDVGGSHSILQYYMSKLCKKVINVDLDLRPMLILENQFLINCDAAYLPIQNDSIDKCVCVSTLEHVKDRVKCLTEIIRVLKPGGILTLTIDTTPGTLPHNVIDTVEIAQIAKLLSFGIPTKPSNILINNEFGFPIEVLCIKYTKP